MIPEIKQLLILQNYDQKLRTLRLALEDIPVKKLACERVCAEVSTNLNHIKNQSRAIELETKNLALDAQAKRDAVIRFKQHQLKVRKNEEYAMLNQEIVMAEDAIIKIEDRQLELMEASEKIQSSLRKAQKHHAEECKKLELQLSKLATRTDVLRTSIRQLEIVRIKLADSIESSLLNQYSKLFKNSNGRAVVPIEGDICSGCHMKVTPQTVMLVKSEKTMTHCLQCGCILYLSHPS